MRIFLNHARKDADLARQLGQRLVRAGFKVWSPEDEITPGDNWAKKIGKALDGSDLMVALLTPAALSSDCVRWNIDYALMSRKYEQRVFSVLVGTPARASKDVPWPLLGLPHWQVTSAREFDEVVREIRALRAHAV